MKTHSMKAGLVAVVVALVLGSSAWSRPPETDEDIRKDLRELKEDLARLKKDVDLDRREAATQARRLEDRLERMAKALEKLAGSSRRANERDPDQRTTGTIRLHNRMNVQARVTIDGLMYSIPPRSVQILRNQPTGAFTYDVTGDGFGQASYRSTLANNETLTVFVHSPLER